MNFFKNWYLLFAVAAVAIIWTGAGQLHLDQGWPRGIAILISVAAFGLICWLGNRQPRA